MSAINEQHGFHTQKPPAISILDRMVATDLLQTLVAVWSVIVVIIVSRKFISVLAQAVEGQISSETLLSILGLKTIIAGASFLPAAIFMATLMVLGRMYRDQEMSAVLSAGGGAWTIYRAVFVFVLPLTVLTTFVAFYVSPWSAAKIESLITDDEKTADVRGIAAGKFSEYSQGDLVFYVENIGKDGKMEKVFVQNRQHGKLGFINSEKAHIKDLPEGRYIVFEHGEHIQGKPGDLNYVIENFSEYAVRIEEKGSLMHKNPKESIPTAQLFSSELPADIAELQRRFSIPIGVLLLSFIAVPLAQLSPRGGVYGNMIVGFLIYFSYGNLAHVTQVWVIKQTIPNWLGAIGIHVFLLIVGSVLLARWYGWRWLFSRFKRV
ncbi:Lipopolysaccharide export system permease protein LptF [Patescibacteria group bacterium]|nr:Lipopolysaccharide export system permease protein LptF [Patescibacteria group bacterium]